MQLTKFLRTGHANYEPRTAADLGFLETGRLAAETPLFSYWIFLDFLGFSRPNRDLSMGYKRFSLDGFSPSLCLLNIRTTRSLPSNARPASVENALRKADVFMGPTYLGF
jgi:hypothetical protein